MIFSLKKIFLSRVIWNIFALFFANEGVRRSKILIPVKSGSTEHTEDSVDSLFKFNSNLEISLDDDRLRLIYRPPSHFLSLIVYMS